MLFCICVTCSCLWCFRVESSLKIARFSFPYVWYILIYGIIKDNTPTPTFLIYSTAKKKPCKEIAPFEQDEVNGSSCCRYDSTHDNGDLPGGYVLNAGTYKEHSRFTLFRKINHKFDEPTQRSRLRSCTFRLNILQTLIDKSNITIATTESRMRPLTGIFTIDIGPF